MHGLSGGDASRFAIRYDRRQVNVLQGRMMKATALAAMAMAALATTHPSQAEETADTVQAVGETTEFHFDGKPSTGYGWFLDPDASTGLDIAQVEALGYGAPYTKLLGADAPFRFRISCLKAGYADLLFNYRSPDGMTVAATRSRQARCE